MKPSSLHRRRLQLATFHTFPCPVPTQPLAPHRLVQIGNANSEDHHTEVGFLRYGHGVVVGRVSRAGWGAGPLVGALRARLPLGALGEVLLLRT